MTRHHETGENLEEPLASLKQAARTDWEFGSEQANAGNVDTWQSPGSGRNPHHSLPARGFNGTVVLRPNGRDDRDRNRGIGPRHCRGLRVEPTQRLGDTKPLRSGPLDKLQKGDISRIGIPQCSSLCVPRRAILSARKHGRDRAVNRRLFITMLSGAAAAWPLAARAQQGERVRRIGLLMASVESDPIGQERVQALRRGLREFGWVEGRNLEILLRWSGVDAARVQEYTAELVHLAPDLIVANATPSIAALKRATQSVPLVFVVVNDPVAQGIVSSVARPEGNITGFSFLDYSTVEKSLELLKEVAPGIASVGVMFNPETYPYYNVFLHSFEASARRLSVEVAGTPIRAVTEAEDLVAKIARQPGSGLIL